MDAHFLLTSPITIECSIAQLLALGTGLGVRRIHQGVEVHLAEQVQYRCLRGQDEAHLNSNPQAHPQTEELRRPKSAVRPPKRRQGVPGPADLDHQDLQQPRTQRTALEHVQQETPPPRLRPQVNHLRKNQNAIRIRKEPETPNVHLQPSRKISRNIGRKATNGRLLE